ncbi:MAG: M14 family metallopeptidase [Symbiobacteriaceae bacterium]|nr:M14 family metallopeptidase [Symbiobacteriaceae bacterium]
MSQRVPIDFDRYYAYDELTNYLQQVSIVCPEIAVMSSLGKSYQGRDIWLMTLTNRSSGADNAKPAIYIEGNIHAGEVTAAQTVLCLIDRLVSGYGKDAFISRLLDTRCFYVVPRVNPDGAELYLTTPETLRSTVRPWPEPDIAEWPGLHPSDIDNNGYILQMRLRDDKKGEWKISSKDTRIMIPREAADYGGPYYRILPEGMVSDYQGEPFPIIRTPYGIDMNRNFPSNWDPSLSTGGDFPTSEPEVRAVVEFITNHPNIGLVNSFHTSGGFFYRNPYQYGDDKIDQGDLRAMREIAREGTKVTGYIDVKSSNRACLPEWMYEHWGVIGYTTELWDRNGQAGISRSEAQNANDYEKREELQVRLLQWNDRELCGAGFFPWSEYDHPQLGSVEIGGWNPKYALQNPPHFLLPAECHKNATWALQQAACLPEVEIASLTQSYLGDGLWKVEAVVQNNGYLCTAASNKAMVIKAINPDYLLIETKDVVGGLAKQEIGFLQGFGNAHTSGGYGGGVANSAARVSWIVRGVAEDTLTVTLNSIRGGRKEKAITLTE